MHFFLHGTSLSLSFKYRLDQAGIYRHTEEQKHPHTQTRMKEDIQTYGRKTECMSIFIWKKDHPSVCPASITAKTNRRRLTLQPACFLSGLGGATSFPCTSCMRPPPDTLSVERARPSALSRPERSKLKMHGSTYIHTYIHTTG